MSLEDIAAGRRVERPESSRAPAVKSRDYGGFPQAPAGATTFKAWEPDEPGKVREVYAETAAAAARLWGEVMFERAIDGQCADSNVELCVQDGDVVRLFDVTTEVVPRVLVHDVTPPPSVAGGAKLALSADGVLTCGEPGCGRTVQCRRASEPMGPGLTAGWATPSTWDVRIQDGPGPLRIRCPEHQPAGGGQ